MTRLGDIDISDLADSDRLLLAHELLHSVVAKPAPLSPEQLDEIDRRIAAIDSETVSSEDWEVVRERLHRHVP